MTSIGLSFTRSFSGTSVLDGSVTHRLTATSPAVGLFHIAEPAHPARALRSSLKVRYSCLVRKVPLFTAGRPQV